MKRGMNGLVGGVGVWLLAMGVATFAFGGESKNPAAAKVNAAATDLGDFFFDGVFPKMIALLNPRPSGLLAPDEVRTKVRAVRQRLTAIQSMKGEPGDKVVEGFVDFAKVGLAACDRAERWPERLSSVIEVQGIAEHLVRMNPKDEALTMVPLHLWAHIRALSVVQEDFLVAVMNQRAGKEKAGATLGK